VTQVVRATLAEAHGVPSASVSTEQIFTDARRELVSLTTLGDVERASAELGVASSAPAVRARLAELLGSTWSDRWRKAPAKRAVPPRTRAKESGAHTSAARVLARCREAGAEASMKQNLTKT